MTAPVSASAPRRAAVLGSSLAAGPPFAANGTGIVATLAKLTDGPGTPT